MRGNIREAVRVAAAAMEFPEPIVEIGSLQVEKQMYDADLRPFFPGKQYIGCDRREGRGVDRIEDVQRLSFADHAIGTVLMLETLEHVENPVQAMEEIFRVLRPEGVVLISSCMDFPVHEYPADYWRFSPQGFDLLLRRFSPRRVYVQGHPRFPHSLVGVGKKGGTDEDLHVLDTLVTQIPGTLTQEISPRIGPDLFRLLGTELTEKEQDKYPVAMLHVAYDRLLQQQEEIARLRAEVQRLAGERRTVREV
jgi:SAM-dependent methyltransferase